MTTKKEIIDDVVKSVGNSQEEIDSIDKLSSIVEEEKNKINEKKESNYKKKSKLKKEEKEKAKVMYRQLFKGFVNTLFNDIIGSRDKKWVLSNVESEGLARSLSDVAGKYIPSFEKFSEEINLGFWCMVIISTRMNFEKEKILKDSNNELG